MFLIKNAHPDYFQWAINTAALWRQKGYKEFKFCLTLAAYGINARKRLN